MAEVNTSDRSSLSCRSLFRAAFLAFLCAASPLAQKTPEPSLPKYDLHTEAKMKGTVEEVKIPPKGREKEIAHLLLKTETDTVDVYLCPQSLLVDMGVSLSKGDGVVLTGSKVKQGQVDIALLILRRVWGYIPQYG